MEHAVFEGVNGALSLSVIAFSIVFLVLLGLTMVIFAIRFFVNFKQAVPSSGGGGKSSQKASPQTVVKTSSGQAPSKGISPEVIAAISGALIARLGSGMRIVSVQSTSGKTSCERWVNWGRFEGMQGLDRSAWTAGERKF